MTTDLTVDTRRSRRRRQRLDAYLTEAVDSGMQLVCASRDACRRSVGADGFAEGQLSHVGRFYELSVGACPLRILVVPKQTGRTHKHVTVDQRCRQVESAKPETSPTRTRHMSGTALALRILLGLPVAGPDEFDLDGRRAHVYDCFAMANATLCSRVRRTPSGSGSRLMYRGCSTHLRQTIDILDPTVIVAQGWDRFGESPSKAVASALDFPMPERGTCMPVSRPGGPIAFVAVVHPARHWPTATQLFREEVEPALLDARRIALDR